MCFSSIFFFVFFFLQIWHQINSTQSKSYIQDDNQPRIHQARLAQRQNWKQESNERQGAGFERHGTEIGAQRVARRPKRTRSRSGSSAQLAEEKRRRGKRSHRRSFSVAFLAREKIQCANRAAMLAEIFEFETSIPTDDRPIGLHESQIEWDSNERLLDSVADTWSARTPSHNCSSM